MNLFPPEKAPRGVQEPPRAPQKVKKINQITKNMSEWLEMIPMP